MMVRSRQPGSAFTLVEIVLALGVIAFVLTGIFGLLSAAATSTDLSNRETMVVAMSTQVLGNLRAVHFDALWEEDPASFKSLPAQPMVHGNTPPADSLYYFSGEGLALKDEFEPSVIYQCRVRKTVDAATTGYANTAENSLDLQLIFSWPVSVPEAKRQMRNIYAKVARY